MRNLSNIGFDAPSLEAFQALAEMVYRNGKAFRVGRSQYYCLEDVSGAELWVQIDENDEIAGMNCHYHTANAVEANLLHAYSYADRPLDGTMEAQALQVDAGLPKGTPPPVFAFDLPDAHLVPQVVLPAEGWVQLVGFARGEVHVYENVEDYRKAHPGKPLEGMAPIDEDGGAVGGVSSLMRLDGIVSQAAVRRNGHTGREFYWLELKTAIGKMDVVAATRSLPFLPSAGQVFDGEVRLSGRVQFKNAVQQKPRLIERLFWGASANTRS